MTPEQLDSLAATWTTLARLFSAAPNPETLAALCSDEMLDDWPMPETEARTRGVALLKQSRSKGEKWQDIKDDHFRLVVGAGKTLAPPWESVYRSAERLLFEEETMQVRQFYRRFGLQAPKLNREPDDHISLELEFLATLLTRAMDALEASDPERADGYQDAHADFCKEHLYEWAPEFFAKVIEGAKTCFYLGLGVLGDDAVSQSRAWIE